MRIIDHHFASLSLKHNGYSIAWAGANTNLAATIMTHLYMDRLLSGVATWIAASPASAAAPIAALGGHHAHVEIIHYFCLLSLKIGSLFKAVSRCN